MDRTTEQMTHDRVTQPLADPSGRQIRYLRLSLTKQCSMRCVYCRPDWLTAVHGEPSLTPVEIECLVRHLVRHHGLTKVRLTGGDPTARPDLMEIIGRLASIPGIHDLAMTTNGLTLARSASAYAQAGLGRVNVSLDSLDPLRFERITGVEGLSRVLEGIDAALAAGLTPLKLNTVVLRGENDHELPQLVSFAADRGLAIRFIELMPMGPLAEQWAQRYVPANDIRRALNGTVRSWTTLPQGASSATRYRLQLCDGRQATVGLITPMSCPFCSACNRIRIASDGGLYPCLMDEPRGTLLPAFRPRFDADRFDAILTQSLLHKRQEHPHDGFVTMTHIGG